MGQVRSEIMGQVNLEIMDQVRSKIMGQVNSKIMGQVRSEIMGQVRSEIMGQVHSEIMGREPQAVKTEKHPTPIDTKEGKGYDNSPHVAHGGRYWPNMEPERALETG
eukprot:gene14706-20746_t